MIKSTTWRGLEVVKDTLHRVMFRIDLHAAADAGFLFAFDDLVVRTVDIAVDAETQTRFEISSAAALSTGRRLSDARVVVKPAVSIRGALGERELWISLRKPRGRWPTAELAALERRIAVAQGLVAARAAA